MVIFHSYVKLPEGKSLYEQINKGIQFMAQLEYFRDGPPGESCLNTRRHISTRDDNYRRELPSGYLT